MEEIFGLLGLSIVFLLYIVDGAWLKSCALRKLLDDLADIRELFEAFGGNCQTANTSGHCLKIDEILITFRGECKFRQNTPYKPAKYVVKFIVLKDAT